MHLQIAIISSCSISSYLIKSLPPSVKISSVENFLALEEANASRSSSSLSSFDSHTLTTHHHHHYLPFGFTFFPTPLFKNLNAVCKDHHLPSLKENVVLIHHLLKHLLKTSPFLLHSCCIQILIFYTFQLQIRAASSSLEIEIRYFFRSSSSLRSYYPRLRSHCQRILRSNYSSQRI